MSLISEQKPDLRNERRGARLEERGMKLQRLLAGAEIGKITGPADVEIQSVAYDSRKVTPGAIFFAMRGQKLDGTQFVGEALRRGAANRRTLKEIGSPTTTMCTSSP